jgi:hypothetical protein
MAPEPAEPFRELTSAIHERWPDHPPYGGQFKSVIPHVTVVQGPEPPGVERELSEAAPIDAEAKEVWLMVQRHHRWMVLKRFPLQARASEVSSEDGH